MSQIYNLCQKYHFWITQNVTSLPDCAWTQSLAVCLQHPLTTTIYPKVLTLVQRLLSLLENKVLASRIICKTIYWNVRGYPSCYHILYRQCQTSRQTIIFHFNQLLCLVIKDEELDKLEKMRPMISEEKSRPNNAYCTASNFDHLMTSI